MEGVWRAMEECHRLGLARSIGVSNFSAAKMSRLLAFAAVPPAVNQVELNVGWRQEKVREVCAKNGVVVTAFSPLGAIGTTWDPTPSWRAACCRTSPPREARRLPK